YRGDDGAGLYVSRNIHAKSFPHVKTVCGISNGTQLLDVWDSAHAAFVVDCVVSTADPGVIYRFDALNESLPEGLFNNCSTHCFSVAKSIELAGVLERLPTKLVVYGIVGSDFKTGAGLSAKVRSAADEVTARIVREVDQVCQVTG
ncbi:MAG: hydrogenase maturation protease, partial [candidate division Zixibacteria bacterium]|nr:hydrogenase maturation protease [candidate division Zixibacteria bacterium]